jgi:hypothetical protein
MKTNTIYIDETGNPKNTKTFIICLIIFTSKYDLDFTVKNIENFKYKRFNNKYQELHFNKESFATKINIFTVLQQNKFIIRYYSSNIKDNIWSNEDHIIKSIYENKDLTNNSIIYIDGNISKHHKRFIISKIIKRLKVKDINIKKVKYEDSKSNNLIQLADMCAGCIRRKIERNTVDDKKLYKLIERFITYPNIY